MPFPLGHTAIGLTTYELSGKKAAPKQRLWGAFFILCLSNLPDLDMLAGLIVAGNGDFYHRGPTHSLLFAVVMGYLASRIARRLSLVPPFGFGLCTALIFSHVIADLVFTSAPVSLFWPMEVYFSGGISTLGDVVHGILFKSLGDMGIVMGCLVVVGAARWLRATEVGRRYFPVKLIGQK